MNPKDIRKRKNPEQTIQQDIILYLEHRNWIVREMHASMVNFGWPDLYATSAQYGPRWIEVKLPDMKGSSFTNAQVDFFPKLSNNGTSIWIMTGASTKEYSKLFQPANFHYYFNLWHLRMKGQNL